jgi:hypothetical protein
MQADTQLVQTLAARATAYLATLCDLPGGRAVGSPGNRAATAFFREVVIAYGWQVESSEFACLDWEPGTCTLHVGDVAFDAQPSP